jgi:hypothetical protein
LSLALVLETELGGRAYTMTTPRKQKVQEAIETIKEFHEIGQSSLTSRPGRGEYKDRAIDREAEEKVINPDTLRKARKFAEVYTDDELDALCSLIEEVQPAQASTKAIFGKTHIIRLLSVSSKRKRQAFQRRAVKGGWSVDELESEINCEQGARRAGGKRPRLPAEVSGCLSKLERRCESWRRWYRELARKRKKGEAKRAHLDDLPPDLGNEIRKVSDAVGELRVLVEDRLADMQPARQKRPKRKQFDED